MITRADIVAEAKTWLNTPYHHQAMVKGVEGGVDCAMILIGIFRDYAKRIPADFDPRPYPMQWHLHRDEERYLNWFTRYATQVESPQLGDVVLSKFGRTVSHSGIVVEDNQMVHAYRDAGMVTMEPIAMLGSRIHSYWSIF